MGKDDKPKGGAGGPVDTTDQPSDVVPPITDAQFMEQLLQAQFQAIVGEVLGILGAFAPHLSEQQAMQFAQGAAKEQMDQSQIPMIIRSMIDGSSQTHPTIHLYVGDDKGKVEMKAPKRLEQVRDLQTVAQSIVLLAFVLSPGARAVLRAFGFRYTLAQSKTPAGGLVISGL